MEETDLNEFKYGLIAASQDAEDEYKHQLNILHFCGYVNPPTDHDIELLKEELNTDPEFGLTGRIDKDVFIMKATSDMVEMFMKGTFEDENED